MYSLHSPILVPTSAPSPAPSLGLFDQLGFETYGFRTGFCGLKSKYQPKLFQSHPFGLLSQIRRQVGSGVLRLYLSNPASNGSPLEDPGDRLVGLPLAWPAAEAALPHQPGPTSLTQADPAQTLVVLVFLPPPPSSSYCSSPNPPPSLHPLLPPTPPPPPPPPPPPAVAKLHQKTPLLCVNCSISTICQVEGSHQAGSSRMPPREKQTCWLSLWPPGHTWGHVFMLPNAGAMCRSTQLPSGGC